MPDINKVSIDYDDTLSTDRGKEMAKRIIASGKILYIVTARLERDLGPVKNVAKELGIPLNRVIATNHEDKWKTIKRLNIGKHIDNNQEQLDKIKQNLDGVQTQKFKKQLNIMKKFNIANIEMIDQEELSACIAKKIDEGWDQDQAVAACYSILGEEMKIQKVAKILKASKNTDRK